MKRLMLLPVLFALIAGCGGDDDGRVLHFTGRDETEGNFRDRVRSLKTDAPGDFLQMCEVIKDMTARETFVALRDDSEEDGDIPEGAVPKPDQKADPDDLIRSAEIVQEECKK